MGERRLLLIDKSFCFYSRSVEIKSIPYSTLRIAIKILIFVQIIIIFVGEQVWRILMEELREDELNRKRKKRKIIIRIKRKQLIRLFVILNIRWILYDRNPVSDIQNATHASEDKRTLGRIYIVSRSDH